MSPIRVTVLLALSPLLLPCSTAVAQRIFSGASGVSPTSNPGRATEAEVPHCVAAPGGSRMRRRTQEDCTAPETTTIRTEQELKVSLEVPQDTRPQCEATTLTEYSQRNTMARVTGTISIANCPAGTSGTYTVTARLRDDSGESKTVEFPESWQRDDAADASFNTDYPIGENVELTGVRIRNLVCTCAETPQDSQPAPAPAQN